ncbi:adhesion G-protein coupled receptor G6-like [Anoplopoma fimbria]|uniref:adhesion G-protein coupled receptor G6-like n=1 Tax=Anoplopoma fimbria TaxID=229290 RepID=UPI0023ED399A|nr:adhesion G-protein coupled receptor G6-like [Anoplopoma fimbria]
MPLLFQMTLCIDIRVVVPGAWVAFSYSSVLATKPELGLEGDDEALYGWLLRVRHRFPIRLSPKLWHRVCLRRDVPRNSFSLEVDGRMVADRTVIAQAIPPTGSLWLGCRPRDRPPGAALGELELYLFRMWPDVGRHGPCEDGTVIGWNARYWGVTSPRARQRDPYLLCGSSLVNCNVSQLCSPYNASFWMSITVEVKGSNHPEHPVEKWVSSALGCDNDKGFCPGDGKLQNVQVNCRADQIRQTTCDVLVQLSRAITECELQLAAESALEQAKTTQFQASIRGQVDRVALSLSPTPAHLHNLRLNPAAVSIKPPGLNRVHCCICCCNCVLSVSQVKRLAFVTVPLSVALQCLGVIIDICEQFFVSRSVCQNIIKHHKRVHLECHGTKPSLYSCMVILEMSGPVNGSSLKKLLQDVIDNTGGITITKPLTRMVICGPQGSSVITLLASNLTWVDSDLLTSDVCQPNPTLLECRPNENLAVLLTDSWPTEPPTTKQNTTTTPEASTPSVTNTTEQTERTPESSTTVRQENASQATAQPNMTTPLATIHSTQPSTEFTTLSSVNSTLQVTTNDSMGSTLNATTLPPNHTTTYNVTTAPPSTNHTTDFNITTVTHSPNDTTAHNVTTVGPITPTNHTTVNGIVTATSNYTTQYNVTAAHNSRNSNSTSNTTISTFTASTNYTTVENITTTTVTQNKTATDDVTTAPIGEAQQNTTAPSKNMTTSTTANYMTTFPKNSTVDNVTSVVDNATKSTVAPLNNQTGNHTTARVTNNTTTTTNNDNFTTASTVSTTINPSNQTTTNDFNQTTQVNLTTTAADAAVDATTSNTTTTTMHSTVTAQINNTISKVPTTSSATTFQTTTLNSTTATKPEFTSTTTSETTTSQEAQEEQADQLLNQTQDASKFNSSQVAQLAGNLEKLLDGPNVSQALGQKVVKVISNLMEGDSLALSTSANRLINLVDDLGLKLVVTGDKEVLSAGSLVLAVREVDGTNFPETSVDIFNTENVQLRALSRSRSKRSGSALGSVSLPSSLTKGLSPEQQKEANRVQFNFYTKPAFFQDATLDNETLVSPVLAASVANLSISNLAENISFTIRNINPILENFTASCAFWQLTQNGGEGHWNSTGCFVVNTTPEETTCSCNHLTSFAILLDLSREGLIDPQQAEILSFITYIGCGISAIFLALTLLTYLSFDKLLRDIPAKILVQLCLSLLLLNLVFLLDGWLALYPAIGLCISTAFFLHYFLLTSFTWAGLEALHMYLSIVQVFTPYLSRYMLKFSLMGWGIPLIVVIIVIAVDKDNYGLVTYGKFTDGTTGDFCWLRNDIAFYVGVVAYFLLIFTLCMVVFIAILVQLSRIKKQNPQNQPPNRGVMTDLRSIAGLIILLGLTWGFALFAWGPLYIAFVYLFTIFNSLQGLFVFIFHCAVKESVQRQWRTYLCFGKLRLPENSAWSRTATQNTNRDMSTVTATTSAPLFTSRSSSVTSNGTVGSDSVFRDSGISDGSNSDAVLNEIHRRNLSLGASHAHPAAVQSQPVKAGPGGWQQSAIKKFLHEFKSPNSSTTSDVNQMRKRTV